MRQKEEDANPSTKNQLIQPWSQNILPIMFYIGCKPHVFFAIDLFKHSFPIYSEKHCCYEKKWCDMVHNLDYQIVKY